MKTLSTKMIYDVIDKDDYNNHGDDYDDRQHNTHAMTK